MEDKIVLNQLVADLLKEYRDKGEDKISYNYSYPLEFNFGANTSGTSQVEKITISGSQLFILSQVKFIADGDLDILLKEGNKDIEIIGTFNVNEWNGRTFPQVFIEHFEVTERDNMDDIDFSAFNAFGI